MNYYKVQINNKVLTKVSLSPIEAIQYWITHWKEQQPITFVSAQIISVEESIEINAKQINPWYRSN